MPTIPIALYPFNESSKDALSDEQFYLWQKSLDYVQDDEKGLCLNLNSPKTHLAQTDTPNLNNEEFTISFWMKMVEQPTSDGVLFGMANIDYGDCNSYRFVQDYCFGLFLLCQNGKFAFQFESREYLSDDASIEFDIPAMNKWTNITITLLKGRLEEESEEELEEQSNDYMHNFYAFGFGMNFIVSVHIDGALVKQQAITGFSGDQFDTKQCFMFEPLKYSIDALFSDLRIYDVALSSAEIAQIGQQDQEVNIGSILDEKFFLQNQDQILSYKQQILQLQQQMHQLREEIKTVKGSAQEVEEETLKIVTALNMIEGEV